jgi:hypothetical protein
MSQLVKKFSHLYDPHFEQKPNHRYAMQPIVLKIVNADGFGDYFNGLKPDYALKEDYGNLMSLEIY